MPAPRFGLRASHLLATGAGWVRIVLAMTHEEIEHELRIRETAAILHVLGCQFDNTPSDSICAEDMELIESLTRLLRRCFNAQRRSSDTVARSGTDEEEREVKADFHRRQTAAHSAVAAAVANGELVRPEVCDRCEKSADRIEAHHHDYDLPLAVEWLCKRCHSAWHQANGRAK